MTSTHHGTTTNSNVLRFRTSYMTPIYVFIVISSIAGFIYRKGIFQNILIIALGVAFAVSLSIFLKYMVILIAPNGIYLQRDLNLITGKKIFLDNRDIKAINIMLTISYRWLEIVTPEKTIRIDVDALVNSEEFLRILKERYSNILRSLEDTTKFA